MRSYNIEDVRDCLTTYRDTPDNLTIWTLFDEHDENEGYHPRYVFIEPTLSKPFSSQGDVLYMSDGLGQEVLPEVINIFFNVISILLE